MKIRTPATGKMAAETANLAFETKAVDISKRVKFYNTFKNNGNFNSNRLVEKCASGSDGKAAHNESQVLKCYLCDGNHKRINCTQNKTEHSKKNWTIQSCYRCGKRHETRFCDQNSRGSKRTGSNAFIRGETDRVKSNDHFLVPVYCNMLNAKRCEIRDLQYA